METEGIRNRVDESGLMTLDLERLIERPTILEVDLADFMEDRVLLREKPFRAQLAQWVPEFPSGQGVRLAALFCSEEAIVPLWSWMLLTERLHALGCRAMMGTAPEVRQRWVLESVQNLDTTPYHGARLMVKGCSDSIPAAAYVALTDKLLPVVQNLAFGEPCSSVPVFKRRERS
ncbi:DUF2480 family protein [bacterium]|nr:DUF2480 family protein [bacterium]